MWVTRAGIKATSVRSTSRTLLFCPVFHNAGNYNQVIPFQGLRSIRLPKRSQWSLQLAPGRPACNVKNDLSLQFGYTYSKAIDSAGSNDNGYDLNNVSNPYVGWRIDLGPSFFDRTHVAFVNFVYDIPLLRALEQSAQPFRRLAGLPGSSPCRPAHLSISKRVIRALQYCFPADQKPA